MILYRLVAVALVGALWLGAPEGAGVADAPPGAAPVRAGYSAAPALATAPAVLTAPVDGVVDAVAEPGGVARRPPVGPYRWPVDGPPVVARRFEPPPRPWLAGHRGVDLAAAPGAVVRAAGPGVVHFAGRVVDRDVVSIDHPDGLRTTYEPLVPAVTAGQAVAAGDPIGTLAPGHPGCAHAACLHWGLRDGDRYLDTLALLGLARMRLLPLDPPPGKRGALSQ